MPAGERAPLNESALEQMKGELIDEEVAVSTEISEITEEWQELTTPVEEEAELIPKTEMKMSHDDERANLEEELARLDARWARKKDPVDIEKFTDSALDELEESLDGIDL